MITVSECAAQAGLASNELMLGAVPSREHQSLLESYLLNSHRGLRDVRAMIVADMRAFLDLGVSARAADLLIVLRLLLTEFPQARQPERRPARGAATLEDAVSACFGLRGARRDPEAGEGVVISFSRDRAPRRSAPRDAAPIARFSRGPSRLNG